MVDEGFVFQGVEDGDVELVRQQQVVDGKKVRIKEFIFLVELPALGGRGVLEPYAPVHSLMKLEGVEWASEQGDDGYHQQDDTVDQLEEGAGQEA